MATRRQADVSENTTSHYVTPTSITHDTGTHIVRLSSSPERHTSSSGLLDEHRYDDEPRARPRSPRAFRDRVPVRRRRNRDSGVRFARGKNTGDTYRCVEFNGRTPLYAKQVQTPTFEVRSRNIYSLNTQHTARCPCFYILSKSCFCCISLTIIGIYFVNFLVMYRF